MENINKEPSTLNNPRINFLLTKALFIAINQLKRIDEIDQINEANDMQIVLETKFKKFHYSGNVIERIGETYKTK